MGSTPPGGSPGDFATVIGDKTNSGREQVQHILKTISRKLMRKYRALRLAHSSQTLYVAHTGKLLSLSNSCS
jgi:hypothetical protein